VGGVQELQVNRIQNRRIPLEVPLDLVQDIAFVSALQGAVVALVEKSLDGGVHGEVLWEVKQAQVLFHACIEQLLPELNVEAEVVVRPDEEGLLDGFESGCPLLERGTKLEHG